MFKKALIVLAIVLATVTYGFSQRSKADSLMSLVKSVPADTTKVWLLNELVATIIDRQESSKALQFVSEAKDLARLLNHERGLAKALELQGWVQYRRGDFSASFESSNEALKLNEQLKNLPGIARCLISLAAIAHEQKYYTQAIDNFKRAYMISKQAGDYRTMARCMNNLAFNFVHLKQLDSASIYLDDAVQLSSRIKDQYLIAFGTRTSGDILYERKDYSRALQKFSACLTIAEEIGNNFIKASTLHRLGKTYKALNQPDKALTYLLANFEFAKEHDYKEERERTSLLLSEVYRIKKDFENAHFYQSVYLNLHDSLFDQRKADQMTLLQAKFETEIKQTQIELLTKDARLREEEIKSQKLWMYVYMGLLALVIFFVVVLMMSNHFNRKAKHELELKNLEIQRQAQQLTNVNTTKDKLFSIISHDLRSPVASLRGLMEIISSGSLSQEQFVEVTKKLKKNLDLVYDDLDNVLQWAQSQLRGIQVRQEEVRLKELTGEIIQLFTDALRIKGIEMLDEIDEDAFVLADRNQLKLVFRNLIANSIKFNEHGGMIRLSLRNRKNKMEISVADSGVGISLDELQKLFNPETHFTKPGTNKEKGLGIGLLLTKEFVESNGGSIWVTSELGKGATFTFTLEHAQFPIKKEGALSSSYI